MFKKINEELIIIKEGLRNILTKNELSSAQTKLIALENSRISVFDEIAKENNTFLLFKCQESMSNASSTYIKCF